MTAIMSKDKNNTPGNFVAPPKSSDVWADEIFRGIDEYIAKNYVPAAEGAETNSASFTEPAFSGAVFESKADMTSGTAAEAPRRAKRGFFGFHGIFFRPKRKEASEARYEDLEPCEDAAAGRFEVSAEAEEPIEDLLDEASEEALSEETSEESITAQSQESAVVASEDAITAQPLELAEEADLEERTFGAAEMSEEQASILEEVFHAAAFTDVGRNGMAASAAATSKRSLEELMAHVSDTWQESLLHLIDSKGYTDTEVYKRANLDRKLFSKIRSNAHYQPKKTTAVALALALRLNLDETKDLLGRAGYALSPSSKFDLIIRYFIENEVFDLYTINLALYDHQQPVLE